MRKDWTMRKRRGAASCLRSSATPRRVVRWIMRRSRCSGAGEAGAGLRRETCTIRRRKCTTAAHATNMRNTTGILMLGLVLAASACDDTLGTRGHTLTLTITGNGAGSVQLTPVNQIG